MRGVYLAGINRVKIRNGSNLGALGIGALGALSIGALGNFRAGNGTGRRSRLPTARFSRPRTPEPAAGPCPHLAAEKPAAAPPIFPTENARTAASPPDLAAGRIDQAASRRTARPSPPLDKAHQANDWRMTGRTTSRQLLRDGT
jgi:hypothetical protein